MSRFIVEELMPRGPVRVTRREIGDARGSFTRLFCQEELGDAGWSGTVAQANLSVTAQRGTVRGMHFQHPPHAETKLVICLAGAIWDVAVDVRAGSATRLGHVAAELSADNSAALLIPPGFAHGFQTLTDDVQLLYFHSAAHAPGAEDGVDPFDPALDLTWPLPPTVVSERDCGWAPITPAFQGVAP
ncbi:dTDP-4-dehydrorhamnose 3,5-epimerase family protein [Sphingomonas segetis]|jgi:dTDP-4-dehydrorhamnose 3,5-epimerase|uniref:dTDP-4-dehydrorhamnose 3,5-epimerase family protein n=1 Tax=Sphingomonas segetis TaxID=1104779 RepID=UPI0012D2F4FC|nr:dTDP-4-dehydrorhamnose 3,5-epimerase family protein [Sphingomonas segetis]